MSFKWIVAGLAPLILAGCNLPLFEQPPIVDPLQVKLGDSTACLSRLSPVFSQYVKGDASEAQLKVAWDCVSTAVSTFEKSTRGRYEDRFTSRELAHFFEQYFLEKGDSIPDSLMVEIFRIKQLFVGGDIDSITRVEMKNILGVVDELKRLTINLNPSMKVFTFNWSLKGRTPIDAEIRQFEEANQALQDAAKDLAILIEKNGLPYRISNVSRLLNELNGVMNGNWTWISDVDKTIPLVEKLKETLAGGSPAEIAPTEWRRFALLGARGYVQYLRYYYFIQSADLASGGASLAYFVRSIDDLFSYLGDMVDGKPNKSLTRDELKEILEALADFVPKIKISEELITQAMKIKIVFFGGSLNLFVKEDFDRARAKLESFRILTEKFLNYSDFYSLNWKPDPQNPAESMERLKLAESNLLEVAVRLGGNMDDAYDLKDLIRFAKEFDRLYPAQNPNDPALGESAEKYVPIVIAFKNILLSDQTSLVGSKNNPQQQWMDFLKSTGELYSRFMYYRFFLQGSSLTTDPGLHHFNRLVLDSTVFIDHVIEKKPRRLITFPELRKLWSSVLNADLLPTGIKLQSLDTLTQVVVQKILLPPETRLSGAPPEGWSELTNQTLRDEFALWVDNQKFLGLVYRGMPADEGPSSAALLADLNAAAPTVPLLELKMIVNNPLPLSYDREGRWYLSKPAQNYRRSTADILNMVRSAVRLVIRAYAADLTRIKSYQGINLAEANALFADVKPLVVDLELISAGNKSFADSRFRDANLFTAVSNGDDLADYRELSNLFMMIVSGIKLDSMMFADLEKDCRISKPGKLKETWTVKVDCLTGVYAKVMPRHFTSMPDFMKFQAGLDQSQFESVFIGLLKATGAVIDSDNQVKIEDLSLFPHIVQYVEGIYQMYDIDRDGKLTTSEALKAYPRFRSVLIQVSGLKDEQQIQGLFTWMLRYGKAPESAAEKVKFALWWVPKGEKGWDVNASREMLGKILGSIADAMAKPKASAALFDLSEIAN